MNQAGTGIAKGVDFVNKLLTQVLLGWTPEEYADTRTWSGELRQAAEQDTEAWRRYYAENDRSSGAARAVSTVLQGTAAALPQAVMAMLSGGASLAGTATTAGLEAAAGAAGLSGAAALGNTARIAVANLAKDPQYWATALSTVGESYEQALADGADDDHAATYAIVNAILNAMVEIGGGGIQELPDALEAGTESAARAWVDTMLDEGKEEIVQGVIERGLQFLYGKRNPVWSTEDEDAIFNPMTAAKEGGMGALIGGILGGGEIGVNAALRGIDSRRGLSLPSLEEELYEDIRKTPGEAEEKPAAELELPEAVRKTPAQEGAGQSKSATVMGENGNTASGTETAGPIQVGRATTIQHPYQGAAPVQEPGNGNAVIPVPAASVGRANELIGKAQTAASQGTGGFKTALTRLYQQFFKRSPGVPVNGMTFEGSPYLVEIGNKVPGKVISDPNLSAEKLALLDMLPEIVQNAAYVGSGEYVPSGNGSRTVIRYDYFETPMEINGKNYIARFDVEVVPGANNYRTHQIVNVNLTTPEASLVGPAPTASPDGSGPQGRGSATESGLSSELTIAQPGPVVNGARETFGENVMRKLTGGGIEPSAAEGGSSLDLQGSQNRNGGLTNGTEQNGETGRSYGRQPAAGDGGRAAGGRAGLQAGGLGTGAGGGRGPAGQYRTAIERQNLGRALRLQGVSAEALGLQSVTNAERLTAIPEEHWDAMGLRAVAETVRRETGMKPVFLLGGLPFRKSDGGTGRARGAVTGDRIVVQADHLSASAEQIARHEIWHVMSRNGPGMNADAKRRIVERFGREELERVLDRYISGLTGVIDMPPLDMQDIAFNAALDRIMDELMADAYAGINAFRAGADRFQTEATETRTEYWGPEQSQNAAATERMTGPPDAGRFSIEPAFSDDVHDWYRAGMPEGEVFILGSTGDVLQGLGAMENDIYLNGDKITEILHDHPEMTIDLIGKIPDMLEDPVLVLKSKGSRDGKLNSRLVLYSNIKAENGKPIMAAMDLRPVEGGIQIMDLQKVNSAYTRRNGASFVRTSDVLYADKNRTIPLLRSMGLQHRPTDLLRYGSMGSIDYNGTDVKIQGTPFSEIIQSELKGLSLPTLEEPDGDVRYSVEDEERVPQSGTEHEQTQLQGKKSQESKQNEKKPVAESRPIIAKQDLKRNLLGVFSIPEGRRAEIGQIIDRYADRIWKQGSLNQRDMDEFFDRMYAEGVMTVPASEYARAGREAVAGGRVYVPARLKAEFGEDWQGFRRRAFAAGVLLTNNQTDSAANQWNMELAESFPGLFDREDLDERGILERIVGMAEEGKDQKLSFSEYAALLSGQEGVSEDEILDNMERQMDWALRTFAEKANLELRLRDRTGVKIAEERERSREARYEAIQAERKKAWENSQRQRAAEAQRRARDRDRRRELAQRQKENRELRELQQKTLKQLQWLSRNRQRAPEELKAAWDEALGDIDIFAASAANEMHWSEKHQATWRDLADMYQAAKQNDPNFLPSKELERIVSRLDKQHIADMDPAALADLYKAAVGLRTEFYNRNYEIKDGKTTLGEEAPRYFPQIYQDVKYEMDMVRSGYDDRLGSRFFNGLQLTPMNAILRMSGWDNNSQLYSVARMMERGERDMRRYTVDAKAELAPFLEEHRDWVKRSDGQGKDAVWYEIEVPELLELGMGDKPIFGKTVKVWMTPAQKVHMYLESKSYDNLRHMAGGRTFANKELYSEGKRAEAFAQGTKIRLAPETVKKLVSDLTPEEQELARVLERYYNESSRAQINKVSNALYGYDKAIGSNYAPIFTNSNYVKSEPGVFDLTAEGVGNLKTRQYSKNPSYQISAFDAFERSVDQTSRFVGMAIPARNVSTLMNWREANNSMRDVLTHKWGKEGAALIDDLLTELQGGKEIKTPRLDSFVNKALSRYIQAVFGFNPSIVLKQFASYPLAAAYLGYKNMPVWVPGAAQVDTELIRKYSGELAYRTMGYATPETAILKDNPGKMQEKGPLNFLFGGGSITWMDGFTVRCLWTWAENKVRNETELQPGMREQIDAGTDPYYRAVAREFEEAVSRSQPMYDVMHRSTVMRDGGGRAFTLFKTVPQQEYNMLREAFGELRHAKESGSKEDVKAARRKAGRAVSGILIGNLMIGAITFLNALWKNKGKKYRDDEGELTAESFLEQFGKQYISDSAGLVIGGDVVSDILGNIVAGDKWYDLDSPGIEQINEIIEGGLDAANTVKKLVVDSIEVLRDGGDWGQYMANHSDVYLSAVDETVTALGKYGKGMPMDNVKAYLLGTLSWISPEVKTAYEDAMSKADKNGLKGLTGAALETRIEHLMGEHGIRAEDGTLEALAALYEAGHRDAIPTDAPAKVNVNGEDRKLGLVQQQTWDKVWSGTVGEALDELVSSEAFRAADTEIQAKMLNRLYDYATEKAKEALFDDYERKDSTIKMQLGEQAGISPAEYVIARSEIEARDDNGSISQEEARQGLDAFEGMSEFQKAIMWQLQNKGWKPGDNPYDISAGQQVYDVLQGEAESLSFSEEVMRQLTGG